MGVFVVIAGFGIVALIVTVIVMLIAGIILFIAGLVTLLVLLKKRKKYRARLEEAPVKWKVKAPRIIGLTLGTIALAAGFVMAVPGGYFGIQAIITQTKLSAEENTVAYQINQGNYYNAQQLVLEGADVNAFSGDGYSPLMLVCRDGGSRAVDMARFLIDHGADPNAKSGDGQTALMLTVDDSLYDESRLDLVKLLLDSGADVNAVCDRGETALTIAKNGPASDAMLTLLLDAGATEWKP